MAAVAPEVSRERGGNLREALVMYKNCVQTYQEVTNVIRGLEAKIKEIKETKGASNEVANPIIVEMHWKFSDLKYTEIEAREKIEKESAEKIDRAIAERLRQLSTDLDEHTKLKDELKAKIDIFLRDKKFTAYQQKQQILEDEKLAKKVSEDEQAGLRQQLLQQQRLLQSLQSLLPSAASARRPVAADSRDKKNHPQHYSKEPGAHARVPAVRMPAAVPAQAPAPVAHISVPAPAAAVPAAASFFGGSRHDRIIAAPSPLPLLPRMFDVSDLSSEGSDNTTPAGAAPGVAGSIPAGQSISASAASGDHDNHHALDDLYSSSTPAGGR